MTNTLHRPPLLITSPLTTSPEVHIPRTPHHSHNPHTLLSIIFVCNLPLLPPVTITCRRNTEHSRRYVGLLEALRQPNQLGDARRDGVGHIAQENGGNTGRTDGPRTPSDNRIKIGRVGFGTGDDGGCRV